MLRKIHRWGEKKIVSRGTAFGEIRIVDEGK